MFPFPPKGESAAACSSSSSSMYTVLGEQPFNGEPRASQFGIDRPNVAHARLAARW
jgi:hypothetical protein